MTPRVIPVAADGPVRAAFTTRAGGVSDGACRGLNLGAAVGDDDARVRENRRLLCAHLGVAAERVTMGMQVHGATVRRVAAPTRPGRFLGGLTGWPEGDGLATATPGLPLVVLAADCLPILLWDRDGTTVGAVHAGWRGLVAGAVEAAVAATGDPGRAAAAIGPAIGPCCYPTGGEVRDAFAVRFGDAVVRGRAVDLAAAARVALRAAGVPAAHVREYGDCTACDAERFFSYRRDGAGTGRHAGVVWLDDGILAG
ncbi:MAG: peptidoglycan editing factor PgeF [Actinomycetota bacterium]